MRLIRVGRRRFASVTAVVVLFVLGVAGPAAAAGNAMAWSTMPGPTPSLPGYFLNGLSCVSSSFCVSVGPLDTSDGPATVAEWNGSVWSSTAMTQGQDLGGVTCLRRSFCMAVGADAASGFGIPLAIRWNGSTWSQLTMPARSTGELFDVSCVNRNDCEAVGVNGAFTGSLIERWNGSRWSMQNAGANSDLQTLLFSVSCASVSFCMATGQGDTTIGGVPVATMLVERWDGSSWSVISTPDDGDPGELASMSCPSPSFCAAVGEDDNGGDQSALAETWSGSVWSTSALPDQMSPGQLLSVACYRKKTCVAVGGTATSAVVLKLQKSGAWVEEGTPAGSSPELESVRCVADWACVILGAAGSTQPGTAFFAEAPISQPG